jgi:hypothetical protein
MGQEPVPLGLKALVNDRVTLPIAFGHLDQVRHLYLFFRGEGVGRAMKVQPVFPEGRSIIKLISRLIPACKGDDRPDGPILDELSGARTRQS